MTSFNILIKERSKMYRMIRRLFSYKILIVFFILATVIGTTYAITGPATDSPEVTKKSYSRPSEVLHGYVLYSSPIIHVNNQKHGFPKVRTHVPIMCDPGYGACVSTIVWSTNSTDESGFGGSQGGCTFREIQVWGTIYQAGTGYDVLTTVGIYTPDDCHNRGGDGQYVISCIPQGNINPATVTKQTCLMGVAA